MHEPLTTFDWVAGAILSVVAVALFFYAIEFFVGLAVIGGVGASVRKGL